MQDTLLGTDQRLDFRLGIQLYAIPSPIPICEALTQLGNTDMGLIAMLVRLVGMGA